MGTKAKITPLQIYIIGFVLSIISAVVIYFTLISPDNAAKKVADDDFVNQKAIADKQPEAEKDRKLAIAQVAQAKAKWAVYEQRYMPKIDLSNRYIAMRQLWHEEIEVLPPLVEKYLRADHSVQVLTDGLTVPQPPSDPNSVLVKSYTFQLGTFSVAGTFNDVLKHVERWNKFNRLVLVDGVKLSGNSPRLVASYTLTAYETTRNDDAPGPVLPAAVAPSGGGGGGAGGGNASSGFEVGGPRGGGGAGGGDPRLSGGGGGSLPAPAPSGSGGPSL